MTNRWQVWVIILWIQQGHVLKLWHRFPRPLTIGRKKYHRYNETHMTYLCLKVPNLWPLCLWIYQNVTTPILFRIRGKMKSEAQNSLLTAHRAGDPLAQEKRKYWHSRPLHTGCTFCVCANNMKLYQNIYAQDANICWRKMTFKLVFLVNLSEQTHQPITTVCAEQRHFLSQCHNLPQQQCPPLQHNQQQWLTSLLLVSLCKCGLTTQIIKTAILEITYAKVLLISRAMQIVNNVSLCSLL